MQITPGLLDFKLMLQPLKRISPSKYEALHTCALREVWAAGRQPQLLPSYPKAWMGSAIHSLLEEAGQGKFAPGDHAAVATRWRELLAATEDKMRGSWLDHHLVPLDRAVRDFEVRSIRAQNCALEIAEHAPRAKGHTAGTSLAGTELWVQSDDGLVGGFIDYVEMAVDGPTIRDYKSGDIAEENSSSHPGPVKESYQVQLRLYAALYAAKTGQWPARLELIPLSGAAVSVVFDQQVCSALLEDARCTLKNVNEIITSRATAAPEAEQCLARPSPSHCWSCPFRPGCAAYRTARLVTAEPDEWPKDIAGEVKDIRTLGNGKLLMIVRDTRLSSSAVRINGLDSDPTRHPALHQLQPGDTIGLYNLKTSGSGATFSEASLTTIYKMLSPAC